MRTLASFAAATILLTAATSSIAAADEVPANAPAKEAASAPRPGQVIRDANGRRLGAIQSIQGADVIDLAPISPDTLRTLQPEPLETRVVSAS